MNQSTLQGVKSQRQQGLLELRGGPWKVCRIINGYGGRFLSEISRDMADLYGEMPHLRDNHWYTPPGAPQAPAGPAKKIAAPFRSLPHHSEAVSNQGQTGAESHEKQGLGISAMFAAESATADHQGNTPGG